MTAPSPRLATFFHVHLVSDSTGETLNALSKAVVARFDGVIPIEHVYPLVRSPRQLERVLREIEDAPGVVIHTIVDRVLRSTLEDGCRNLGAPCIAALDPMIAALGRYLGASLSTRVGAQHDLIIRICAQCPVQQVDDLGHVAPLPFELRFILDDTFR